MSQLRRSRFPLRPRRSRVVVPSFVLAAVTALAGAGCSPEQIGSAALVDGQRIPVAELQRATTDLLSARSEAQRTGAAEPQPAASGAGNEQRDVLNRLVLFALMDRVAQRENVQVSDGDVDGLDRQFEQFLGSDRLRQELLGLGVPESDRRAFFRYQAARIALGRKLVPSSGAASEQQQDQQLQAAEQRLAQAGRELPVEINPRYGRWLPEQSRVDGVVSGGLSRTPEELRSGAGR